MAVDARATLGGTPPVSSRAPADRDVARLAAKATAAAMAVGAIGFGLWQVRSIVISLLLALTFAAAIRPGVEWLHDHRVLGAMKDKRALSQISGHQEMDGPDQAAARGASQLAASRAAGLPTWAVLDSNQRPWD
jgi:hypothetical protein